MLCRPRFGRHPPLERHWTSQQTRPSSTLAFQTLEPRKTPAYVPRGPAGTHPRHAAHHREEYGLIEYGGLPVNVACDTTKRSSRMP